ncbi:MAG: hypothetical protein Ct9H90mP16_02660 [Candidatus Poseidoniales archaeon]|nr:MAG: hypothetical protein Ct9H90mP16_02660 [Candidatus Poseidoniales archaeon]
MDGPLRRYRDVAFWVIGNMVNNDGAPNSDDHWNALSFVINSPSATNSTSDQSTRVPVLRRSEPIRPRGWAQKL